jgi:hypothetical protein
MTDPREATIRVLAAQWRAEALRVEDETNGVDRFSNGIALGLKQAAEELERAVDVSDRPPTPARQSMRCQYGAHGDCEDCDCPCHPVGAAGPSEAQ